MHVGGHQWQVHSDWAGTLASGAEGAAAVEDARAKQLLAADGSGRRGPHPSSFCFLLLFYLWFLNHFLTCQLLSLGSHVRTRKSHEESVSVLEVLKVPC
jgi:hypothetical protein